MELLAASCRASITRGSCLAGDGVFQVTASALVPSYKLDISLSFLSYTSIQKEPVSCKISGVMAQSNHLATFFFFFWWGFTIRLWSSTLPKACACRLLHASDCFLCICCLSSHREQKSFLHTSSVTFPTPGLEGTHP